MGPSTGPGRFQLNQVGSVQFGVLAVTWAKPWLGVLVSAAFSPSLTAVTDTTGTSDHSGNVVLATTQLMVPITTRRALWSFFVTGGIGLVSRAGNAWQQYSTGQIARTWVLGFGGRTPLSEHVTLRFLLEDNISTAQFDAGLPTATAARAHSDYVFNVAIQYPVKL